MKIIIRRLLSQKSRNLKNKTKSLSVCVCCVRPMKWLIWFSLTFLVVSHHLGFVSAHLVTCNTQPNIMKHPCLGIIVIWHFRVIVDSFIDESRILFMSEKFAISFLHFFPPLDVEMPQYLTGSGSFISWSRQLYNSIASLDISINFYVSQWQGSGAAPAPA